RTMLHAAMPALRNASSKLDSRSLCLPTPLVRNIFLATNAIVPVRGLHYMKIGQKNLLWKSSKKATECQRKTGLIALCSGAGGVADQLAERLADREHSALIVRRKILSRFR